MICYTITFVQEGFKKLVMILFFHENRLVKLQAVSDKLAMLLSSFCVVHCVGTPILLMAIPSLATVSMLADETLHSALLLFVVPLGCVALLLGFFHHRQKWVVLLGAVGIALLCSPVLLEYAEVGHVIWGQHGEVLVTTVASLIVVMAHVFNYRLRKVGRGL